jgi:hypothetical protein
MAYTLLKTLIFRMDHPKYLNAKFKMKAVKSKPPKQLKTLMVSKPKQMTLQRSRATK